VFETISAVLSIIVIDLVLSGDNAVVIGMAARNLSAENRRKAIILGGAGAIGLRIMFTAMATLLLGIPGLQAIGGVLLTYIAFKLIRPQGDAHGNVREADSLGQAIRTIVLADVVMSLDNILAVAGAAHGEIRLLMFGLLLSIPIILFGSELVARLIGRFPAFLYVGVFVLVHAAVAMVAHDPTIGGMIHTSTWQEVAISLGITAILVGLVRWLEQSRLRTTTAGAPGSNGRVEEHLATTALVDAAPVVTRRHDDESAHRIST
jgi:YjbE family integral membrane protein